MVSAELLATWSARLAVLLYALGLGLRLEMISRPNFLPLARLVWTAGCLTVMAHLACGFQFHHWNLDEVLLDTAKRTEQVVGVAWGEGLYFNFLFVLVWLLDSGWWWTAPRSYLNRPCWLEVSIQAFLAF